MITFWFLLYMTSGLPADKDQYMTLGVYATKAECKEIIKHATSPGLVCVGETRLLSDKSNRGISTKYVF